MSMTREEAIEELERLLRHWDDLENGKRSFRWYSKDAVEVALTAPAPSAGSRWNRCAAVGLLWLRSTENSIRSALLAKKGLTVWRIRIIFAPAAARP